MYNFQSRFSRKLCNAIDVTLLYDDVDSTVYILCSEYDNALRMPTPVGDFDPHRRQRCSFHARDSQQLVTELSQLPLHALGTMYTTQCHFSALSSTFRKSIKTELFLAVNLFVN